jgi:hypothetical protein
MSQVGALAPGIRCASTAGSVGTLAQRIPVNRRYVAELLGTFEDGSKSTLTSTEMWGSAAVGGWDWNLRNSPVTVFDGLDQSFADELEA